MICVGYKSYRNGSFTAMIVVYEDKKKPKILPQKINPITRHISNIFSKIPSHSVVEKEFHK